MASYRERNYGRQQGRENYGDRSSSNSSRSSSSGSSGSSGRRYGRENQYDETSRYRSENNRRDANRGSGYNRDFESPRFRSGTSPYDYGYGIQNDYDYDLGRESSAGETFTGGSYGSGNISRENYNRNKEQDYRRSGERSYSRGSGSSFDRDYDRSNYGHNRSRDDESGYNRSGYNARDYESRNRYGRDYSDDYTDYSDDERYNEEERGWWDRASDEVASWFGDEEAARRRRMDSRNSEENFTGRGPKNYKRSDDRIKEDINDRLSFYSYIDASDVDVEVSGGEVALTGTVNDRWSKRRAEDIAESVSGVNNVENRLRIKREDYNTLQTNPAITTGTTSFGSGIASENNTTISNTDTTTGSSTGETNTTNTGLSRKAKTT